MNILNGVRILDLSRVISGPFCSRILGDLGAEVIKVESPGGDAFRAASPQWGGFSAPFAQFNAGKKSVCIDLRTKQGVDLVHRLAEHCDVFLENFRAGLAADIGIGHAQICEINPSIVYCSISGFGQHGPDAGRPAYTDVIQAMSGLDDAASKMFGNNAGVPPGFPASLADTYTSQQAAIAILAALFHREKSGEGEVIDISMLDTMVSVNDSTLQRYLFSNGEIDAPSPVLRPPLQLKDGFLAASIGLNFEKTLQAIGSPDLINDERFRTAELRRENMATYVGVVSDWVRDKTIAEVTQLFDAFDIPYGKVNSPAEVLESDFMSYRQLLVDLEGQDGNIPVINTAFSFLSGKSGPGGPPPRLGEHSLEVVESLLGMAEDEISALITGGILICNEADS